MKRKKVVFVRPPNWQKSGQWKKQGVIRCPLNISMLASFIRENGDYDCAIVDFELVHCDSPEQSAEVILSHHPDYVCFTTLTPRFPITVKIAQAVKEMSPKCVTIAGGPHVTGLPLYSLHDGIDFAIVGEGELALLDFLRTLDAGRDVADVKNLVYRSKGKVVANRLGELITDLDVLPFPAWDLMELSAYVDPAYFKGSHLAMFSSRGCPFNCNFCASAVTWNRKVRMRSVDNIMAEMVYIVRKLNIHNIMFFDDSFALDEQRALETCKRMIDEKLNLNYTVQVRANSLSENLAVALKSSGCSFAAIGVESGNDAMLHSIGKGESKKDFLDAAKIMRKVGLPSIASFIIGLPGDTHETIRETIDFAFELDTDEMKFMILSPYPGTSIYDLAMSRGLVDPLSFEQMEATNYYDSVAVNLSKVSNDELLAYQDAAYARFDVLREKRKSL